MFERVMGLDNNFAESKIDIGKSWVKRVGLNTDEVLVIGDTFHDYEVAKSISCDYLIDDENAGLYKKEYITIYRQRCIKF